MVLPSIFFKPWSRVGLSLLRTSSVVKMNERREELEGFIRKLEFFSKVQDSRKIELALAACRLSPSQLGADILALEILGFKRNGYFIECGAGDGVHLSNTYLLEKQFGWSGILVEPNRNFHSRLETERGNAILEKKLLSGKTGQQIEFSEHIIGELSGISGIINQSSADIKENYQIESITLEDLMSIHQCPDVVDYLSLDVEGFELEILRNFNFSRYRFNFISVEHNFQESREEILTLLNSHGYTRIHQNLSSFDDFYIHSNISRAIS